MDKKELKEIKTLLKFDKQFYEIVGKDPRARTEWEDGYYHGFKFAQGRIEEFIVNHTESEEEE